MSEPKMEPAYLQGIMHSLDLVLEVIQEEEDQGSDIVKVRERIVDCLINVDKLAEDLDEKGRQKLRELLEKPKA